VTPTPVVAAASIALKEKVSSPRASVCSGLNGINFSGDHSSSLVVGVPGYRTEIYIVIPERYELILCMLCRRK
jgi:hypothetical protein